ncbi:MAG TPA: hydantoinase/oxoprolinase family protein, partial [Gammaproteobacteria bacterium]|nr:hydantoinase/oxoprolinase family protein [Gammaproteobacteria bacterium]
MRAGLADVLGRARLLFMQSHGGLAEAEFFHGKDSILSGPAGGVVGMAAAARDAGYEKVVGFDMGGTSTDVSLYTGAFERTAASTIAGVRITAPMMRIHTVASGGGSILKYHQGRLQVGPESAGAVPGPACYGRGGPLTITDANVLLGRIQPDFFPAVFGASGAEPIEVDIVQTMFAELASRVNADASTQLGAEELAVGFLRIAVERMANAIKQISTQRGHDVTEFALCCFGGAAGQHACQVADALGIETAILHPLAGVLSAYGIGLADLRALRVRALERALDATAAAEIDSAFVTLEADAYAELRAQGVADDRLRSTRRLKLKVAGSDTTLSIPWQRTEAAARRDFHAAHRSRFGFVAPARALIVESIELEAIGEAAKPHPMAAPQQSETP